MASFPQKLTVTSIQNLRDAVEAINLLFQWYAVSRNFCVTAGEKQQIGAVLRATMDHLRHIDWKEEISLRKIRYAELVKQWEQISYELPPPVSPVLVELQAYETLFQQLFDIATSLDLILYAEKVAVWWAFLDPTIKLSSRRAPKAHLIPPSHSLFKS